MTKQKTQVKSARELYDLINGEVYISLWWENEETFERARSLIRLSEDFCYKDKRRYLNYIEKIEKTQQKYAPTGCCCADLLKGGSYALERIKQKLLDDLLPKTNPEWTITCSRRREATLADLVSP